MIFFSRYFTEMLSQHPLPSSCDNNIADIEDIVTDSVLLSEHQRVGYKTHIVPRARKIKSSSIKSHQNGINSHRGVIAKDGSTADHVDGLTQRDSYVPGKSSQYNIKH